MKHRFKYFIASIFFILVLLLIYLILSIVLLNGKFVYQTSEFETNRLKAIQTGDFIADIKSEQFDTNSKNIIDSYGVRIWLAKRNKLKFYGFIFHVNQIDKDARIIVIESDVNSLHYFINNNNSLQYQIPNSIECEKGDTILLSFNTKPETEVSFTIQD